MNLTKMNHRHPTDSLGKWIDNLFNSNLGDVMGNDSVLSSLSVNITENDSQYTLQLAAPGLGKQDFDIRIKNDYLIISVEEKNEKEENVQGTYTRREFHYEAFERTFRLDENVNREAIKAAYEDGVLKLDLPKKEVTVVKPTTRTIEIN